jgi:predicted DNA-binding transcriptional regulator YafY
MRRSERLFAIAEHLRARRTGVTAAALAERFGVTLRTIYRDLDSLRTAELPVVAERGRGGGYALERDYSMPPVNFNPREAAVLISAGRWLAQTRVLPFTRTLEAAVDKVQAALSRSAQRELLVRLDSLQYVGVPAPASPADVRAAVERAWFEGRALKIRYDGARGPSERTVRIRQIVMARSETLLNCDDLEKGAPRQLRLDRIAVAEVVEGH